MIFILTGSNSILIYLINFHYISFISLEIGYFGYSLAFPSFHIYIN